MAAHRHRSDDVSTWIDRWLFTPKAVLFNKPFFDTIQYNKNLSCIDFKKILGPCFLFLNNVSCFFSIMEMVYYIFYLEFVLNFKCFWVKMTKNEF